MKALQLPFILLGILALAACGGGGGGSSSACDSVSRISGGESCERGSSNVAFIVTDYGSGLGQCTGSYISQTSVLTAAHCFEGGVVSRVLVATNNAGRFATEIHTHPLYDGSVASPFDIAIIKVNEPISRAPLPLLLSTSPTPGDEVVAFGYGVDQNGLDGLDRIQQGLVPLKATFTTYEGTVDGTAVITSQGAGLTCPGDSGGPVLARNAAGQYGIFGITRFGPVGCSAEEGRPVGLSSTQTNGAIDFIAQHVPDAATN